MSNTPVKNFLVGYYGNQIFWLTKEEAEALIRSRENKESVVVMKDKALSTSFLWVSSKTETNVEPRIKGSHELLDEAEEKKSLGHESFELFNNSSNGTPKLQNEK